MTPVMRILLVSHQFSMSGAAVMLLELADVLLAQGHELQVGTLDSSHEPLRAEYERRGIKVVSSIPVRDFDIAIANTIAAAPAVLQAARSIPTIWWIHESDLGLELLKKSPEWREAFDLAHRIVFPNAWVRDNIYRSFLYRRRPENLVIVPNGLRRSELVPVAPKSLPFRVVCVGSIHASKRQGDLVVALENLSRRDIELVLVGKDVHMDPPIRAAVDAAPERYRLTGQVSRAEAFSWTASADMLALVSDGENQPICLGEAAEAGVPVVLSGLQALTEMGWRHGDNCLMQPVGNVAMLANNLSFLCNHPMERERLAKAARRMRRHYRFDVFANRMTELIADVVAKGPRAVS